MLITKLLDIISDAAKMGEFPSYTIGSLFRIRDTLPFSFHCLGNKQIESLVYSRASVTALGVFI